VLFMCSFNAVTSRPVARLAFRVWGVGFRVCVSGFRAGCFFDAVTSNPDRIQGLGIPGYWDLGNLGVRVWSLESSSALSTRWHPSLDWGLGFGVWGFRHGVSGMGIRV